MKLNENSSWIYIFNASPCLKLTQRKMITWHVELLVPACADYFPSQKCRLPKGWVKGSYMILLWSRKCGDLCRVGGEQMRGTQRKIKTLQSLQKLYFGGWQEKMIWGLLNPTCLSMKVNRLFNYFPTSFITLQSDRCKQNTVC